MTPTVVACLLLAALPAAPPPGALREVDGLWQRTTIMLPGAMLGYALPRLEGARRSVVILVAAPGHGPDRPAPEVPPGLPPPPPDAAKEPPGAPGTPLPPCPPPGAPAPAPTLYRLQDDALIPLPVALPPETTGVDAIDIDGDGRDEVLVITPGSLLRLTPAGLEPALSGPDIGRSHVHPRAVRQPAAEGAPPLALAGTGSLRVYGPAAGPGWSLLSQADLPLQGRVGPDEILVSAPEPEVVGRDTAGSLFLATPPEAVGGRRLRSILIEVTPAGRAQRTECWMRLPGPEEVLDHAFFLLGGRPLLFTATRPTDRLRLFGEKQIRLYPLLPDRSRLGHDPVETMQSRMNLWQEAAPVLRDVDGDTRPDLVLAYWKGLMDDRVVLDVYRGEEDGGFVAEPRSTAFDVVNADRSVLSYGPDITGDGLPDLVLRADGYLRVYPGRPASRGRRLVDPDGIPLSRLNGEPPEEDPSRPAGLPFWSDEPRPRFADMEGDGRQEILLVDPGDAGRPGWLQLLGLR